jgi:hypothetical protein
MLSFFLAITAMLRSEVCLSIYTGSLCVLHCLSVYTLVFSNCIVLVSHGSSVVLKFLVEITKMDMFCDEFL